DTEATSERQRFDWLCKLSQQTCRMSDPVHFRISGSSQVHVFYINRHVQPLCARDITARIAPPLSRFFSGFTHAKSCHSGNTLQHGWAGNKHGGLFALSKSRDISYSRVELGFQLFL